MNSKILLVTLFFTIGFSFQNCGDGLDCDFGPVPDYFDVQGMEVQHWDSSNQFIDSTEISFEDYGFLAASFEVEYIAYQEPITTGFSFINSLYGCSPPPPGQLGSKEESFENISVITINDYDENHFAGDTINDLVDLFNIYGDREGQLTSYLLQDEKPVLYEVLLFSLKAAPTLDQEFQARLIVELSTGESYEALSGVITFN